MRGVKISIFLFLLSCCFCLTAYAQTSRDADKETKKWLVNKLEKDEKTFQTTAAGETVYSFYVKFDGCRVSVTRVNTFTSRNLSSSAYTNDGTFNPNDRLVKRSRYTYSFDLADVDFSGIKFASDDNKNSGKIILPIIGGADLVKVKSNYEGIVNRRFQSKFIFHVDKTDGEKAAEALTGIARQCRDS